MDKLFYRYKAALALKNTETNIFWDSELPENIRMSFLDECMKLHVLTRVKYPKQPLWQNNIILNNDSLYVRESFQK